MLTAISLPTLFRLASHLHQHRKARVVHTLTQDTVLAVHPHATLSNDSPLAVAFAASFGRAEVCQYVTSVRYVGTSVRPSSK